MRFGFIEMLKGAGAPFLVVGTSEPHVNKLWTGSFASTICRWEKVAEYKIVISATV